MAVRFVCQHCSQRLSVAQGKVGQRVRCPACAQIVVVPAERVAGVPGLDRAIQTSTPTDPESFREPTDTGPSNPFQEFAVVDALPSRVLDAVPGQKVAAGPPGAWRAVTFPRYLLYVQAVLLVVVAIAAFMLGNLFGRSSVAPATRDQLLTPRHITGTIRYRTETGGIEADSEAVVIAVPSEARPDEKLSTESLRPDRPPPDQAHPAIASIRSWGGDYARAGPAGEFRLELPRAGDYFVLLLSSHVARPRGEEAPHQHLAQIARYFIPADQLLGKNDYLWSEERIVRDTRLDHTFRTR